MKGERHNNLHDTHNYSQDGLPGTPSVQQWLHDNLADGQRLDSRLVSIPWLDVVGINSQVPSYAGWAWTRHCAPSITVGGTFVRALFIVTQFSDLNTDPLGTRQCWQKRTYSCTSARTISWTRCGARSKYVVLSRVCLPCFLRISSHGFHQ